ncbi:MAG: GNAT family N-acetyltransferase [Anaerolineae bacterium]
MFVLTVDADIHLRLHDSYQVDAFFNLIVDNHAHLSQWMVWVDNHQTVNDTYRYIMWEREQFAQRKGIATQVYYHNQVAGSAGLMIHDWSNGYGEIGYWLGEAFTGKGIITRAVRGLVNFAFNTLNLHKLVIRVAAENHKSAAVAKRLGFPLEGVQVQQQRIGDQYHDYHVYYMLRANWQERLAPHFEHAVTEQVKLRPFMMYQTKSIFALIDRHRASLRKWVEWVDHQHNLRDTVRYIQTTLDRYQAYEGLDAGIWYEGQFCGQISLNSWSLRNYKGDLGYWLADSFTGKGIMTQAARTMLNYAFRVIHLHRIELLCAVENERSCAVAKRLNFTHEGVMRCGERVHDRYYDVNVYALLQPDWQG